VVAGQLPRQPHNAPLHLFSASPEMVGFGQSFYRRRSATTSQLLDDLFERFRGEGFTMAYTMADFKRDYLKRHFKMLTPEEQRAVYRELPRRMRREMLEALLPEERRELLESLPAEERRELLESLPLEERLAGLSAEEIRHYLDRLNAGGQAAPRKPRRNK
jgi:hypothetical protein